MTVAFQILGVKKKALYIEPVTDKSILKNIGHTASPSRFSGGIKNCKIARYHLSKDRHIPGIQPCFRNE